MSDIPIIKDVRLVPVVIPLARPMRTASGALPDCALGLIEIETDASETGHSYIFAYTPRMLKALEALTSDIKGIVIGKTIEPEKRFADFQATFRLLGIQGLLGMVIAGIDMALWDALGKLKGEPVCRLLGAEPRALKAYDSYGLLNIDADGPALEATLGLGFKAIKIKLGGGDLSEDIARVAFARDIVGPDIEIMVDYNQSLDVPDSLERISALKEFGIAWIEEPVPAEDIAGHKAIKDQAEIPVQTGENWWFPAGASNVISRDASDLIMPDIMKIGGFTGWMQVAQMAADRGIQLSSHAFVEQSAHALAATPTAHWLEYLDKARPVLVHGYDVVDGHVTARGPGLGLEWDQSAVDRYRI
jgi:mandelate racemase